MNSRTHHRNGNRRILASARAAELAGVLAHLAGSVKYGGNPEHKRNPGDYGLVPPAAPRRGKSLCDDATVFRRQEALHLLTEGFRRGLVDARWNGEGWPRLVWAVTKADVALEARCDAPGSYYGYPLPDNDPFAQAIFHRWWMP